MAKRKSRSRKRKSSQGISNMNSTMKDMMSMTIGVIGLGIVARTGMYAMDSLKNIK